MRHFVIVGILVIVAAVGTYAGLDATGLLPVSASTQAGSASTVGSIDWLWNLQVIAISFLFALIVVPLLYSLVVFKRKKGDTTDAEHIEGNTALEITWTIIPLFIVVAFAYMGAYSLREIRRVDPQAMVVKVHARQFSWSFEYPEYGGFVSDELRLPINRQVLLEMDSTDVIHSFWVPEFRLKQDVVPGRVTELRITPDLLGSYKVRCAELCGAAHYNMRAGVIVASESDFTQWAMGQQAAFAAAQTPEGKGEILVKSNGCLGCHSIDGKVLVGPSWQGLLGSQVQLSDGSTVSATEDYIKESILQPASQIVAGFEGASAMPSFTFTDEELSYIIAYLQSLK